MKTDTGLFPLRRPVFALVFVISLVAAGGCSKDKNSQGLQQNNGEGASSFYSPAKDDIVKDPDTGLDVLKNIINVTISKKAPPGAIDRIVASVKGEVVGYDKGAGFYQIRVKAANLGETEKIARQLIINFKEVEVASKCPVSVHVDPYYVR